VDNPNKSNLAIVSLLLVIFVDSLCWGLVFPLFAPLILNNSTGLLPMTISGDMRSFIYEFSIAIYCIFMFLFSPILGELSDKYGRKKILLLSMVGLAAGFLISMAGTAMNSLFVILLGRVISGGTAGSLSIAQAAMIDISTDSQKASRIGLIALANGIGFSSGPFIGGLLEQINIPGINNFASVFLVGAIFGICAAVFIKLFFKETFSEFRNQPIHIMAGIKNIYNAFTSGKTVIYFGSLLLSMLGYTMFFSSLPIFLHNKFNLSGINIGYFLSYFAVLFSLSLCVLLPKAFKSFSIHNIVITSLMVQLIAYTLFAFTNNLTLLSLLVAPVAFVVPMMYVGIVTLISNNTDSFHQGKAMGIVGSIAAATWALGPLLTGALNGINVVASMLGAVIFLSISIFMIFTQNIRSSLIATGNLNTQEN
jgi:MFS transporter, DHA1 family, tetracycline resistance protein